MIHHARLAPYALSLCLLLTACGGGGGDDPQIPTSTADAFFDCDGQGTGIAVRNEGTDLLGNPDTHRIVEIRVAAGTVLVSNHTRAVDIAPGQTEMICTSPSVTAHELFVKYDDGTNGCVRFEASPLGCDPNPAGNGSSTFYEVSVGETEPFKVRYRGF